MEVDDGLDGLFDMRGQDRRVGRRGPSIRLRRNRFVGLRPAAHDCRASRVRWTAVAIPLRLRSQPNLLRQLNQRSRMRRRLRRLRYHRCFRRRCLVQSQVPCCPREKQP